MIAVLVGPGGVGKGTIAAGLVARDPRLWLSRSWTTRPRRPGEPADAYHFVNRKTFLDQVEKGGFLEHAEVVSHLYGTPRPQPPLGRDVLFEIDVQGARQVRALYPEAVVILVVPPSEDALVQRMRARGDTEQAVRRRLALGREEEREARTFADAVVVNDHLDRAVEEVAGILEGHRRTPRPTGAA